jgi:hypothetical protein
MPAPCLAYLLDTPDGLGAVVTHRCSRPAGHPGAEHEDRATGATWTGDTGVTWAATAVYPAHFGWPWDTAPGAPALPPNAGNGTVTPVSPTS